MPISIHHRPLRCNPVSYTNEHMKVTPDLCIAARNLIRLTRAQLASEAGIAAVTLKMFEDGTRTTDATAQKLLAAFEAHGVHITNGTTVQTIRRRREAKAKRDKE